MTDERRYRTEIPNIIDDLGLDPHERALYVHYKRACGGNDCEWVESVRVTAQRTKMSVGRASEARKSLVERGLIRLISKGNDGTAVRAVNIWDLNTLFYQQEYRPDIDGWKVEQLREWCEGVHNMNTLEQEELPDSQPEGVGVHIMKAGVHIMNNKKEPIKNKLSKDNSGKEPPKVTEEKVKDKGPKTLVKEVFMESSNLPWPGLKSEEKFWWGQFGEIVKIFDNDSEKAMGAVKSVIEHMKHRGLSITGPKSIVNLCRQVAGGQPLSNGRDSPDNSSGFKIQGSADKGYSF